MRVGASCSNRTDFLNLSGCSSFTVSDPLWPMWTSLILFSSCCFSSSQMRPHVDPPSAPHSQVPETHPLCTSRSSRASFLSFTRSVSAIRSLYALILAFPVKVLSMIVLIRSRHSLLCGLITLPCDARAAQPDNLLCDHEPRCQQTNRRIFLAQTSGILSTTILVNGCHKSDHLPRRATQAIPVRRGPCIAQSLSRPTFAAHSSVLGNVQNCSRSITLTDKDSLSHPTCK